MRIETELLVWLKGTDLFATTAELTLVDKMGFSGTLLGLKRFDIFRFSIEAGDRDPRGTIDALKKVLDRQSTFYNRNKHAYSLACRWDGGSHADGVPRDQVERRWIGEVRKSLLYKGNRDFDGKDSTNRVILKELREYLAEVMVDEEDASARASVAAKLQGGVGVKVECNNKATLWWLALRARNEDEAAALVRQITVTERRDRGLLLNPNYQHAEFVFVRETAQVSND